MSLKKHEGRDMLYISYVRETVKDMDSFKRELMNATSLTTTLKDVIVDFTGSSIITSPEIGTIVRLLNAMQGSTRTLRLILPPPIKKMILATNIQKLKNLQIYEDKQAVIHHIQQPGAGS